MLELVPAPAALALAYWYASADVLLFIVGMVGIALALWALVDTLAAEDVPGSGIALVIFSILGVAITAGAVCLAVNA